MNTASAIIMLCGAQFHLRVHYIFGSLSDAFCRVFFPFWQIAVISILCVFVCAASWWWQNVRKGEGVVEWMERDERSVGQTCVVIISIFVLFCSIFTLALLPYYVNAQHWNFNYTTAKIRRIQMQTRKLITFLPFHFQQFFTLFMTKEYKRERERKKRQKQQQKQQHHHQK